MAENIQITTEYIRLDAFLKLCGVSGTGGEAKLLIQSGGVLVDGEPCPMRGKKLRPGASVQVKGKSFMVTEESRSS